MSYRTTIIATALAMLVMAMDCSHEPQKNGGTSIGVVIAPLPPKPASSDILGPVELAYLESALRAIKMTPRDLLYRKNLDPGLPFRLQVVDRLMANPIEVPFRTDDIANDICWNDANIENIIDRMCKELDLNCKASSPAIPSTSLDFIYDISINPSAVEKHLKDMDQKLWWSLNRLTYFMAEHGKTIKETVDALSPEGKKNLEEDGDSFEVYAGYESFDRIALASAAKDILGVLNAQNLKGVKGAEGVAPGTFGLDDSAVKGDILFYAETKVGEVIVGGSGPNEYIRDFSLIIDLGGDDRYTCRAGGTDGRTQPPVAICVDLGGNNVFDARMKTEPVKHEESDKLEPGNDRISFCQGAALAGIGILMVEGDGNNTFAAGDWSQGAAHLGVGVLWRKGSGDDSYQGLDCVQGAACLGIGIIKDDIGNDRYKATFASQGFGAEGGFGLMLDRSGNDNYYAGGRYEDFPQRPKGSFIAMSQGFGYGLRPGCSGGIGALIDNAGDDFHLLDNQFGMGGSYWFGYGMLVDDAGNDSYQTGKDGDYDGYTMGAPIHLAVACLIDHAGNDIYNGNKIGPAVGWDMSPGWLVDGGGDDIFSSDTIWNWIAAGVQNGCGFLVKKSGGMKFDGVNMPCGQEQRDNGSIGVLLNLGGNGSYKNITPKMNGNVWWSGPAGDINSKWCIGIDEKPAADFGPDNRLSYWPTRMPGPIPNIPESPMEGIEQVDNTPHKAAINSAKNLVKQNKAIEALNILEEARAKDPADPELLYELAAIYGESDSSRGLTELTEAVKCGFADTTRLSDDPRLAKIKALPGYVDVAAIAASHSMNQEEADMLWAECVKEQGSHWEKSEVARNKFKELGRPGLYYAIPKVFTDSYERSWVSTLITYHGKNAVPVLMDCMRMKDKNVKMSMISLLGEIGDQRATEALLPYLGNGGMTDAVCIALGLLKDKRAVPAILRLSETDRFKESELFRKIIAVSLGRIGDEAAVPHLIKNIKDEYFWVRYPAEEALIKIGEPSVPALIEVVKEGQFPSAAHAMAALGRIKDSKNRSYAVMVKGLENMDWAMRAFAAEALGEYGNAEAATLLENLSKTETHPFVKHKIEWAIGKIKTPPPDEKH